MQGRLLTVVDIQHFRIILRREATELSGFKVNNPLHSDIAFTQPWSFGKEMYFTGKGEREFLHGVIKS